MKETRAYKRLKELFPGAHWTRIESWTEPGIFDVNGCLHKIEIWIETKQSLKPVKGTSKIQTKVRLSQVIWEQKRRARGGRTFVALMVGSDLYVLPGKFLSYLKTGISLSDVQLHAINPKEIFNEHFIQNT